MHKVCRHAKIELLPFMTNEKYDTVISDDISESNFHSFEIISFNHNYDLL